MLDFIRENWRIIVDVAALLLSIIICLIKKKPIKIVDGLKEALANVYLDAINAAEETDYKGLDKLNYAVDRVWLAVKQYFPHLCLNDVRDSIVEQIEKILETPQKK